jgi:hypothetical protein
LGCDVVILTLVDVANEGLSITFVVRVFNIPKRYAMMIGVLTTLLMGLALTPFLIMGLALTACLFLGLALYPIRRIWFPDCTSKK